MDDFITARLDYLKKHSQYPWTYNETDKLSGRVDTVENESNCIYLINAMFGSIFCHYGFQIDTYSGGCDHDCVYCYARSRQKQSGNWDNTHFKICDIGKIWQIFHIVFETDKRNAWRKILENKIPVRLGGFTDCFLNYEKKTKLSLEIMKILDFYQYPYVIVTKSDLIARDEYLAYMNRERTAVQISIPSLNNPLVGKLEPGAPDIDLRLQTLQKLSSLGYWTAVRINPLFPIFPDGYYSRPGTVVDTAAQFNYFSYELIDRIAACGARSVIAGFIHLDESAVNEIERILKFNLYSLMTGQNRLLNRNFFYSTTEIRAYYERIHERAKQNSLGFSTCYLGQGDAAYAHNMDLWSNRNDCCNMLRNVPAITKTACDINTADTLKTRKSYTSGPARILNYWALLFFKSLFGKHTGK